MCLKFLGERTQKSDRKTESGGGVRQTFIGCTQNWQLSNSAIMLLSEIKSYVVVPSFYIKMMKRRTLQACSLRHSIKEGMFSVQGKLDLFKSGRGGVLLPPSPPLATRLTSSHDRLKLPFLYGVPASSKPCDQANFFLSLPIICTSEVTKNGTIGLLV